MKNSVTLFIVIVIGLGLVLGFSRANPGKPSSAAKQPIPAPTTGKPAPVKAVAATQQVMTREFSTTGTLIADNLVTIRSMVEGPVAYFPWREGGSVKHGEKLVEIDRPVFRQEFSVAQATLEVARNKLADLTAGTRPEEIAQTKEMVRQREDAMSFARLDHERLKSLVASGALPGEMEEKARVAHIKAQTDLAAARERLAMLKSGPTRTEVAVQKALVNEAAARVELAKAKFDECVMYAPFSATVAKTHVRPGDLAAPRAPLLDLYDPASVVVRFAVPEALIAHLKVGMVVQVKLDAYPGQTFAADIVKVYAELEKATRTRAIEAKIRENNQHQILPGMFARVSAELTSEQPSLVIPEEAVVSTPRSEKIVFVVIDGQASRRIIETGIERELLIEVLAGLKPGEMVVTKGSRSLKNGMPVVVVDEHPKTKLPQPKQVSDS